MFDKKKVNNIGLSPFDLVFRGTKKIEKEILKAVQYSSDSIYEYEITNSEELNGLNTSKNSGWLNVYGIDNSKLMELISDVFSINNLLLSDVMNPSIRPRYQEVENNLFINVKLFSKDGDGIDNLSIIISKHILFTFQEKPGNYFEPIRERLRAPKSKMRKSGPDYLAFALLDVVIDTYIFHINELGERIEDVDQISIEEYSKDIPEKILALKRELNIIRKVIKPTRELLHSLAKMDTDLIHSSNRIHFKELVDNINEANDLIDNYREMLYDMLNMYHTNMSSRLNDIMRLLTIISVIFIPITFIAGIYGTNFDFLPELHFKWGYFAMLGAMSIISGGMIWYFKRRKWF
ncbi:MAG: magnesium/cobalt transporter CorA [Paludibacter sp.]